MSNHSGGVLTPDWNVLAPAFYGRFGYGRPLYTLAHYGVFFTPFREALGRLGVIHASRNNAVTALRSGAVVLAFPGGDYDAFRPTLAQNVIDFGGRTGYVRTAIQAGVPIVPAVSIGVRRPNSSSPAATGWQSTWVSNEFASRSCLSPSAYRSA
ncbi:hypothetical protein NIIDMKKI_79950 [Mycobacterium kansasii]|uniref:Phospholipid/glycerol acyltransferase domain-containing protein n=1 Tax=Mycobacterium kansasii TaxID=1768 RepID=A0A7G1IS05_MYCKA|nr:hypothetical protein NIIDMKKI_79950 [Mycobacterium kansasii]